MTLSLRAQKAQAVSALRARGYWPRLARTSDKAVVLRPLDGGRRYQARIAQGIAEALPQFRFNSKRNWWEADLGELAAAYEALAPVHLSAGAREYLGLGEGRSR